MFCSNYREKKKEETIMPTLESSIYIEPHKKKKDPKAEAERQKGTAILFIHDNPTPLFTRQFNAEKQAVMEYAFSEEAVENPEVKKERLRGYIF
jgi:hypothetical protein